MEGNISSHQGRRTGSQFRALPTGSRHGNSVGEKRERPMSLIESNVNWSSTLAARGECLTRELSCQPLALDWGGLTPSLSPPVQFPG